MKENKIKIAILAIIVIFATLFYIEYARSNRYITVPSGDGNGCVFDTKKEMFIRIWKGNVKDYKKIEQQYNK